MTQKLNGEILLCAPPLLLAPSEENRFLDHLCHGTLKTRPPGVGKSHIAQSIGMAVIRIGQTVLYHSIFDAVRDMLYDEAFDGHGQTMARYLKPDLLILDDMGIKELPKWGGEYLSR